MSKISNRLAAAVLIIFICGILAACGSGKTQSSEGTTAQPAKEADSSQAGDHQDLLDCPLVHESGRTGILLDISIEDFNALGFAYGDSVDLEFSNGYKLSDIPYYNGYYVEAEAPLLVAYPGADHVRATLNYGDDLWKLGGLSEGDTGSVLLHEKGKYKDIQDALDIHYTDDRADYSSDEVFANFREVTAGNIREKVLFRSASPCNNKHNRAPYVNDLAEKAGVNYILDLADDEDSVEGYIASEDFNSPYFLELYKKGNIHLFDLSMNYVSDDFKERLAEGLTVMADKEGPYLSHCTEGKDRTGFFCILVEALCGADYKEIEEDYMLTYDNYYGINKQSDPERYNTLKELNMDAMLKEIVSDENIDITSADLSGYAKDYMVRIGVKEETVEKLKDVLQ